MRRKRNERRKTNLPTFESCEQAGEPPNEASRIDPTMRRALAHPELPHAIVEHRRARRLQVERPLFDLPQMHDKMCNQPMTLRVNRPETRDQLLVGKFGETHARVLPSRFSSPAAPRRRAIEAAITSRLVQDCVTRALGRDEPGRPEHA